MVKSSAAILIIGSILASLAVATSEQARYLGFEDFAMQTLDETNVVIHFNSTLPCGACLRGGYVFCNSTTPTCCEPTDITCIKCLIETWKDPVNTLINMCGSIQAKAQCGNNSIFIDTLSNSTDINIDYLNFGESCTYRLISNCGYPKIEINQTGVDVVVASLQNSSLWSPLDNNFSFQKQLTQTLKAINGAISYTYGGDDGLTPDTSCNNNRTIFVTITNVNQGTTLATSRLLQGAVKTGNSVSNIGITFSATQSA